MRTQNRRPALPRPKRLPVSGDANEQFHAAQTQGLGEALRSKHLRRPATGSQPAERKDETSRLTPAVIVLRLNRPPAIRQAHEMLEATPSGITPERRFG